jgi:hypothetical protein
LTHPLFNTNLDELVKRSFEAPGGSVKKFVIQGVVFLAGTMQYIWYAKCLSITYNEGDRTFYDAINLVLIGSNRKYNVCEPVLVLKLLEMDLIKYRSLALNAVRINADHRKSEEAYRTEFPCITAWYFD